MPIYLILFARVRVDPHLVFEILFTSSGASLPPVLADVLGTCDKSFSKFASLSVCTKVVVDEGAIFPWEIRRVAQMKAGRGITLKVAHGGFTGCSLNYKTAVEHGLFCYLDV